MAASSGLALWRAPAERSGDGALDPDAPHSLPTSPATSQSGVALRLPPHSKGGASRGSTGAVSLFSCGRSQRYE